MLTEYATFNVSDINHCELLIAVRLRPSATKLYIRCLKQVAEKPRWKHLKRVVAVAMRIPILTNTCSFLPGNRTFIWCFNQLCVYFNSKPYVSKRLLKISLIKLDSY